MSQSKVYYYHTSKLEIVKRGYVPAATIALRKEGDKFTYGVAICSQDDNFSKKYGRNLATARLECKFGESEVKGNLKDLPEHDACMQLLFSLAESVVLRTKRWKKKISKFNNSRHEEENTLDELKD